MKKINRLHEYGKFYTLEYFSIKIMTEYQTLLETFLRWEKKSTRFSDATLY